MSAPDLLQKLLDENNLSLSLNTDPPVSANDGTWVIKAPKLVVTFKKDGQSDSESGGNA